MDKSRGLIDGKFRQYQLMVGILHLFQAEKQCPKMEAALWFVLLFSVALPLESAARSKYYTSALIFSAALFCCGAFFVFGSLFSAALIFSVTILLRLFVGSGILNWHLYCQIDV